MPSLLAFLGAEAEGESGWLFAVPRTLHGAFGGAFGGILAACTLVTARSLAPGRVPNALDCRFLRGLPAGAARTEAKILRAGRSLTNVSVDLFDEQGRLCTHALVSLVDPASLHRFERAGAPKGNWIDHSEATKWPAMAPIIETIDSRVVGTDDRGIATAVVVPWDVDVATSAESACMAADMAVGPPVGGAVPGGVGTPNPDLSLRFCGEVSSRSLVGIGRLDRANAGIAATRIEVYSEESLVATGVSTSLLLPPS